MKTRKRNPFVVQLRRNQTDAESKLWYYLRDRRFLGYKFRRQYEIKPYIVDFYCSEHGLIIEVDGGHHASQKRRDQIRTDYFNRMDFRVLRFWDHEVLKNINSVLEIIRRALKENPHPALSLAGRGDQL